MKRGDGDEPVRKLTKKELAEQLRRQVDTVGQEGKPGEQIQKVISVGMLSEGWDARTVTHIMGLRAFSSQLLCEQVVGRGLGASPMNSTKRRICSNAEYVNIFGVPFTFLPMRLRTATTTTAAAENQNRTGNRKKRIRDQLAKHHQNRSRYRQELKLDLTKVKPLESTR